MGSSRKEDGTSRPLSLFVGLLIFRKNLLPATFKLQITLFHYDKKMTIF